MTTIPAFSARPNPAKVSLHVPTTLLDRQTRVRLATTQRRLAQGRAPGREDRPRAGPARYRVLRLRAASNTPGDGGPGGFPALARRADGRVGRGAPARRSQRAAQDRRRPLSGNQGAGNGVLELVRNRKVRRHLCPVEKKKSGSRRWCSRSSRPSNVRRSSIACSGAVCRRSS